MSEYRENAPQGFHQGAVEDTSKTLDEYNKSVAIPIEPCDNPGGKPLIGVAVARADFIMLNVSTSDPKLVFPRWRKRGVTRYLYTNDIDMPGLFLKMFELLCDCCRTSRVCVLREIKGVS